MPSSTPAYQKVPGTGLAIFQMRRLYVGSDHLLQVTVNGLTEQYHRFYFKDVQVLSFRHTWAGRIWNFAWGGLAVATALTGSLSDGDARVWVTIAAACLVLIAVNVMAGPTCHLTLTTAVQTQKLAMFKRQRRAQKFIAWIRPHIIAAQGPAQNSPPVASSLATPISVSAALGRPSEATSIGSDLVPPPPPSNAPQVNEPLNELPPGSPTATSSESGAP